MKRTSNRGVQQTLKPYAYKRSERLRLIGCEGFTAYQVLTNSECRQTYPGVRARVLRSASERGTTQTIG